MPVTCASSNLSAARRALMIVVSLGTICMLGQAQLPALAAGSAPPSPRVVLYWETAYAKAFQIQTSPDGSTWTTIYSTTTGTGGTQALSVSGTGRYIRMYGTQHGTGYGYSLWEFQVLGT